MAATMHDVADKVGVSIKTVSRVINHQGEVSKDTRKRVLAAIEELGYQPSAVARSLRTRSTDTVGLLVSHIELPFFASIARGVQDAAEERGRTVVFCNTDEDPHKEAMYLHAIWGKRVDGLILAAVGQNKELIQRIQASGIPIVLVDRRYPGVRAPFVGIHNREASCQAIQYLIEQGHRRIGLVAGISTVSTIVERVQGYRDAHSQAGLPVEEALIRYTNSRAPEARQATRELLCLQPPITAIYATVSDLTLGVLQAFKMLKVQCPQEISLLGFDDETWAAIAAPAITAVRQPPYQMGYSAVEVLFGLIKGETPFSDQEMLLEAELMVRDSVVPPIGQLHGREVWPAAQPTLEFVLEVPGEHPKPQERR